MQTVKIKILGTSLLMVQSERLANPLDPMTKELKALTSKRKKTDDDLLAIYWVEWQGGLHHDPALGPFLPGANLDAAMCEAAKLQRRGKDVKRALMVVEDKIRIEYDGPRDQKKMYESGRFTDVRGVRVKQARTMRCRPIFREWSMSVTVNFDESVLNESDVMAFAVDAGRYVGIGTFRPRYGRFEVSRAA